MSFQMDDRLTATCIMLIDWPLCRVLLKNNADYPWLILVPRQNELRDVDDLSPTLRHQLIDEISQLSTIVKTYFKPDKLNVGTLGNIVSQLHIHIVARYSHDKLWPHGIWQAAQTESMYSKESLKSIVDDLQLELSATIQWLSASHQYRD